MTTFNHEPNVTKYHFEVVNGRDLSVAIYLKGHQAPDMFDYLADTRLLDVLKVLEAAGYSVCMYDHGSSAQAMGVSLSPVSQKMNTIQKTLSAVLG